MSRYLTFDPGALPPMNPLLAKFGIYCSKCGSPVPLRRNFDPMGIPRLLPNIWVLDVNYNPTRFSYRLMGTSECEFVGADFTGRDFNEVHANELRTNPHFVDRYLDMARSGRPTWRKGRPMLWKRPSWNLIENLMVPFSEASTRIDFIYCCTLVYRSDGTLA